MIANPLGLALRNRHAGHHTLVWVRPGQHFTSPRLDNTAT